MLVPDNEGRPLAEEPAGVKSTTVNEVQVNGGAVAHAVAAVVSEPTTNVIAFKTGTAVHDTLLSRWNLLGRAARDSRLSRSDLAVLHAIADRIGDDGTAWPSVRRIADDASADKRTVTRSISRMCDCGYLLRKSGGFTTANVYRLGMGEPAARGESAPMGELASTGESTGRGEAIAGYGRTRPEGVGEPAHVILPVNPPIESTQRSVSQKRFGSSRRAAKSPLEIPEWLPAAAWSDWHAYRQMVKPKAWTTKAQELSLATLTKLRSEGHDPLKVIEASIEKGWTGLFPINSKNTQRGTNNADHTNRPLSAVERVRAHVVAAERRDADVAVGHLSAYLVAPDG